MVGLGLAVLLLAGGLTGASADTDKAPKSKPLAHGGWAQLIDELERSDDPRGLIASMDKAGQVAVWDALRTTSITAEENSQHHVAYGEGGFGLQALTEPGRFYGWTRTLTGRGMGGVNFKFSQRIDWCWDDFAVTSVPFSHAWGHNTAPFWSYVGLVGVVIVPPGGEYYEAWRQGKFKLCIGIGPFSGCIQEVNPRIDMYVFPGPDEHWDWGG